MKNVRWERNSRLMRQYHRHHQWRLENGLYIPHEYPEPIRELSWWDDVGFILNGKRIMVWWVHPRMKYTDAINDLAWKEVGEPPKRDGGLFDTSDKQWKKVGRSRKKVVAYLASPLSDDMQDYYEKLRHIETRLEIEGIDLKVSPSMSVETLSWCRGVTLCMPMEVRNKIEIVALASLVRKLLKGQTTLAAEFPGYQYGQNDWLSEADVQLKDQQRLSHKVNMV